MPDSPARALNDSTWSLLAMYASAATGADIAAAIRSRQAGTDPSHQERQDRALVSLRDHGTSLRTVLIKTGILLVALKSEAEVGESEGGIIRRFQLVLYLNRLKRTVHLIHQRLLSLYPAADEDVIEATRRLETKIDDVSGERVGEIIDESGLLLDDGWMLLTRLNAVFPGEPCI